MRTTRSTYALVGLALALVLVGTAVETRAGGTASGLAVAVTADGSRLVAGGSNRAFYELDPETLEVKGRIGYDRQVMAMAFSADGAVLVVESTKALEWLKADTFEVTQSVKDAQQMRPYPSLGLVAFVTQKHPAGIRLYGITDGQKKGEVIYRAATRVAGFTLSPDGKKLAVLYARKRSEDEPKVSRKDVPEEIRKAGGLALTTFEQQHDGYTSMYDVFDVETGKLLLEKELFFGASSGGFRMAWRGDVVYAVTYDNANAKIDAEGGLELFLLENSYNYARGGLEDGSVIVTGGLRKGTRLVLDSMETTPFECSGVPGFPEYYKEFTVAADGTAYAGTTTFRVVRIDKTGKVTKTAAIY